jgi:hypothetical protein
MVAPSHYLPALTFGQLFAYKDWKLRIPRGLRCSKKGITTMPNDTHPCKSKTKIDAEAKHAIDDIDKILNDQALTTHKELLIEIKEHLKAIAMDPHKAQ